MSFHSSEDPEENLPDWLKALRKRQAGESEEQTPSAAQPQENNPEGNEEEPAWLTEIRKRHQGESAHEVAAEDDEKALTDTQPNQPSRLEKHRLKRQEKPQESAQPPAVPEVPDWLNLETPAEDSFIAEPDPEEIDEEPIITPAFSNSEQDQISPGELPSWLQAIRPGGTQFPGEDSRSDEMLPSSEPESAGPLAGLSGVLPVEPQIAKIGKAPIFSSRLEVTDSQYKHAAALRDLLAMEAQPKEDHATKVALPTKVLNAIMAGVLMLAVIFPLFTQSQAAPRPELNALPESAEVFNLIDVLPVDAPILIAFDVQPALYGEIKAAVTAVFTHLLEKEARLVFISTQPTGPALAERLLSEELVNQPLVTTGNYANLGYLSGGMAAISSFSSDPRAAMLSATEQDPWQSAELQPIEQVNDFALVLVVTTEAEDGRVWIEQAAPYLSNGLIMISTAQAGPVLRSYLQNEPATLRGLVAGLAGSAYYERLRAQDGLGRVYWDSYSYGLGAIVLLVLLGGLYGRVIHMRPEKAVQVKS